MIMLHIPEAIAIGFILVILGVVIGQIIGQLMMNPIINTYKETCKYWNKIYTQLSDDYIELMRKYYELG